MEWNPSPILLDLGVLQVRWYGLMFASGIFLGYLTGSVILKREGKSQEDIDSLLMHMVLGTIIGARLGHCLFYEPEYYLANPLQILMIWQGGLASHGGTLGIMFAIWLYVRKHADQTWLWLGDRLTPSIAITAGFIRIGNFFNSEIIGRPTDLPWGIIFSRIDDLARHPAQLYEALCYWTTALVCFLIYRRFGAATPRGLQLGVMLIMIFGGRFFLEFIKENQVTFEQSMTLNMGQLLSVPFVLLGIGLIIFSRRHALANAR